MAVLVILGGCDRPRTRDRVAAQGQETAGFASLYADDALVPSRLAECARYQDAVGGEVRRHLGALPAVRAVSAVISLPACDPLIAAVGAPAPPSASVVLTVEHGPITYRPDDIAALTAAAVSGLRADQVAVRVSATPDQPNPRARFATVGPFAVAAASRIPLLVTATALIGLIFGLALWAFCAERINSRLRARLVQYDSQLRARESAGRPVESRSLGE